MDSNLCAPRIGALLRAAKAIRVRLLSLSVALCLAPALASAQFAFCGVGDLPGGIVQSEVRDATRVGGVLYAVGGSSANSAVNDTAFLWTSTGGMTALPPLTAGVVGVNGVIASAITPDAAYIASRARFNPAAPGQRHAVRVTTAGLLNLDLGTLPGNPQQSVANAISSDGSVLYGFGKYDLLGDFQAVRFTAAGPTITAIPFLNVGDIVSNPAPRGVSADGSVMVGTSAAPGAAVYGTGNAAFRYVQGTGVSAIPPLPSGTWSIALALTPDGNQAVVVGDSPSGPNGEVYLYNATAPPPGITTLGTPAAGWQANTLAGVNSDGSLVAIQFGEPTGAVGASFIHNSSGWHELNAIVAGTGIDLTGWSLDIVEGMSADGTRIWGAGQHNGNTESFIVELPARYLAAYAASPPAQSIVGSYTNADSTKEGAFVLVFLANGTYYQIQVAPAAEAPAAVDGFERGTYTWDPVTGAFTVATALDSNGDAGLCPGLCGVSGIIGSRLGNIVTLQFPGGGAGSAALVTGSSPIVGSWVIGDTTVADSSAVLTFFSNGTYLMAQDGPSGDPTGHDGMERGTYTWDAVTGAFTATTLVDTNGSWGLSNPQGPQTATVSGNTLTLDDGTGPVAFSRVIAPPLSPGVTVMMNERIHGAAGPFDLVLTSTTPPTINHNPTTEPRTGPNHSVVFTFDKPVTAGTVLVTEGTATAGTPVFSGYRMTVPLTGVTDKQYVTVSVGNVDAADGGTGGSGSARVGFLTGNVTQSRKVLPSDVGLVRSHQLENVVPSNYLFNITAGGKVLPADVGLTRASQLHSLPAP